MAGAAPSTMLNAMTTTSDQPTQPGFVDARLRRPLDDRAFRGVCAAIGRYTNTDPVLWRVIVAVTAVFGGAGFALYLAGWLLIPEEGTDESIAQRHGLRKLTRSGGSVALGIIAAILILTVIGHGHGFALVLVLAVLGWVVWRHDHGRPVPRALAWTTPAPTQPAAQPTQATSAMAEPAPAAWQPMPARVKTRRTRNGRLSVATVSAGALVTGLLLALRSNGSDISAVQILAANLIVVGCGLLAGAFLGRPRLLVTLGLLLTLATVTTAVASTALHDGVGQRTWAPTSASDSYRLGSGEATLDLTEVARRGVAADYDVKLGFGHLVVIVPVGATATVDASARFGDIVGLDTESSGERVHKSAVVGDGPTPITLRLRVTAGQIEVRHG